MKNEVINLNKYFKGAFTAIIDHAHPFIVLLLCRVTFC